MKKLISVIVVVMMVAAMLVSASAVDTQLVFEAETVEAKPGEDVTVSIRLKNNPGISSAKIRVVYTDAIKLKDYSYVIEAVDDYAISFVNPVKEVTNDETGEKSAVFNWMLMNSEAVGDQTFATMTFHVDDTATGVIVLQLKINVGDVFGKDMSEVSFETVDGAISVVNGIDSGSDSDLEPEPEPEPDSSSEEPEPEPEPDSSSEEPEPEPEPDSSSEEEPEPEPEPEPDSSSESVGSGEVGTEEDLSDDSQDIESGNDSDTKENNSSEEPEAGDSNDGPTTAGPEHPNTGDGFMAVMIVVFAAAAVAAGALFAIKKRK